MHEVKPIDHGSQISRKQPGRIDGIHGETMMKKKSTIQEEPSCNYFQEMGVQTYLRMDGTEQVGSVEIGNNKSPMENQKTNIYGSHFIFSGPSLHLSHGPHKNHPSRPAAKLQQYKSLDNMRNITQKSIAPSHKTIIIAQPISGNVCQSHVRTEKAMVPTHGNLSHIDQRPQLGNQPPPSLDFAYNNVLFNSYIPHRPEGPSFIPTKMAPFISERPIENGQQVIFWREKYEQLKSQWETLILRDVKEREVGVNKVIVLQQKLQDLQGSFDHLNQQYNKKLQQNRQYYQRIQQLQASLNRLQLHHNTAEVEEIQNLTNVLRQRESQISALTEMLEEGREALIMKQKNQLMEVMQRQNEQLQEHLQSFEAHYGQDMRQMQEHMGKLQGELQFQEAQLRGSPLKGSTFFRSENSQVLNHSFDNVRVSQLEALVAKLKRELASREEAFVKQLQHANHSLADLSNKLKIAVQRENAAVTSFQAKIGEMESQLNKRDSVIRQMRDQIVAIKSLTSHFPSSGFEKEGIRVELDNLRKRLFQRERENTLLKERVEELQMKLEEVKDTLEHKSLQNQQIRQQLVQKKQEVNDIQNLTKENNRLRNFMVKKNEELSEMANRLSSQERRVREQQTQLHYLEEKQAPLQQTISRREQELDKLSQHIEQVQGNYAELELELERQRNINEQYQSLIRTNFDRIEAAKEEADRVETEMKLMRERIEEYEFLISEKEQFEVKALKQIKDLSKQLEIKAQEIEEMAAQQGQIMEVHIKSIRQREDYEEKIKNLQIKCSALESALRKTQQRAQNDEKEADLMKKELKKHQKCKKLIDDMKQKIAKYQIQIINLNMNRSNSPILTSSPSSPVFQKKVIYHLKQQNQRLQSNVKALQHKLVQKNSGSMEEGTVRHRLNHFIQNLEKTIDSSPKKGHSADHSSQLRRQRPAASQLPRKFQNKEFSKDTILALPITSQHIQLIQEQIQFYRTKNQQLQQRVATLLILNTQLKQALENQLAKSDKPVREFFEREVRRLRKEVQETKIQRDEWKEHAHKNEAQNQYREEKRNNQS